MASLEPKAGIDSPVDPQRRERLERTHRILLLGQQPQLVADPGTADRRKYPLPQGLPRQRERLRLDLKAQPRGVAGQA